MKLNHPWLLANPCSPIDTIKLLLHPPQSPWVASGPRGSSVRYAAHNADFAFVEVVVCAGCTGNRTKRSTLLGGQRHKMDTHFAPFDLPEV